MPASPAQGGWQPLRDVRVVSVEQYGAGPFGSLILADLGADVIKVEDPRHGGDIGRQVPPFAAGDDSLFFQTFNRNKRTLDIDLSTDAGREVLHDLVRRSDALYSNLRGDLPERFGLTYRHMAELNPRIVCCSLSGYGMTGPRAKDPAYDYILQGIAGWMSVTGEPHGPPAKSGLSMVDYSGGMVAALSVLAGVLSARRDGVGMDCDLSLFDVAVSLLTYPATWWLNEGYEVERRANSAHPSLVPFQNFQTSDGWIVVGCAKEKFWARLAEAIGQPQLVADPRLHTFADRRANADTLLPVLEKAFLQDSSEAWIDRLTECGVPCAPVNTIAQALEDPQTRARELIIEVEHPRWGRLRVPGTPARVGRRLQDHRPAPDRNQHAGEVLTGLLDYDQDHIERLRKRGAFG